MSGKAKAGKRVALVLGSGGARGYAHIGVIEELEARGYEIVAISGCSMGALVGGIYAAGQLPAYRDWVCQLDYFDVLKLVDVTWSPMDGLTLFAAGTFLDPLYDEFENSGAGDISGQTPAGISETALSLAASYDFTLPNGWDAFVRGDWQYESPTALTDDPDEVILLNGLEREVSVFNAAAGFDVGNGVDVSIWGRNIFNDEYIAEAFPAVAQAGSMTGYPNAPRAFGITVGYEF